MDKCVFFPVLIVPDVVESLSLSLSSYLSFFPHLHTFCHTNQQDFPTFTFLYPVISLQHFTYLIGYAKSLVSTIVVDIVDRNPFIPLVLSLEMPPRSRSRRILTKRRKRVSFSRLNKSKYSLTDANKRLQYS